MKQIICIAVLLLVAVTISPAQNQNSSSTKDSLTVKGNATVEGYVITKHIKSPDGVVHIGDSSMTFTTYSGQTNPITGATGITSEAQSTSIASSGMILGWGTANSLGIKSMAFGSNTKAYGDYSYAFGSLAQADANYSMALGYNTKVSGTAPTYAIAIGSGYTSNPMVNSTSQSLAVGFNSNVPTLVVTGGNGTSGSLGKVGIGTSSPQAILDVSNGGSMRILGNSSGDIHSTTSIRPHFATSTGDFTIYEGNPGSGTLRLKVNPGGNVSIGSSNNSYPLDVTGIVRSSSFFRSGDATNYSLFGWNSSNHIIDGNGATLLINYGSGRDVGICTGGSGVVSTGKNMEVGYPTRNTNVALNVRTDGSTANAFQVVNSSNIQVFNIANDGSALITTSNTSGSPLTIKNSNLTASPNSWNATVFEVKNDGKTYIGDKRVTTGSHTDALLTVEGKVVCQEVRVFTNAIAAYWADYVFKDGYTLMPLNQVEQFYKKNKHLPDVPSTEQVLANGNNLLETDALLLKKIEELTIYIVEQNKEMELLKKEVEKLKRK